MNICNSADLDWIEQNGLDKEDIKKILNKVIDREQDIKNPIFYKLLKNYVSDIPPVPKYNFLLGCASFVYLVSEKYNKKILLLGDIHIPHEFKNNKNSITCTSYFEKYFNTNTKLIDFFIEIPLYTSSVDLKDSELSYFYHKFIGCYKHRNCSFRIHATDVRELLNQHNLYKDLVLPVLMPLMRSLEQNNFVKAKNLSFLIEHINDIGEYLSSDRFINNIPLGKEIRKIENKDLKRNLENFYKNSCSTLKLSGKKMYLDISEELQKKPPDLDRRRNIINIYTSSILYLLSRVIEAYTLARMFKKVKGLYNPEPKYIVVFQGDAHIKNLQLFLLFQGFQIKFEKHVDHLRIIDISTLPQPIFE